MKSWLLLVYLAVAVAISLLLHLYIYRRLFKPLLVDKPWVRWVSRTTTGISLVVPLGMLSVQGMPRSVASPVMWVIYTWIGLLFFWFILLLPFELARLAVRGTDGERRRELGRLARFVVGGAGLLVGAEAVREGLSAPEVVRHQLRFRRWPETMRGFRIVQISDIHVGPTIGASFIGELVDRINALEPDLVAITGDLVDGSVAELAVHVAPLGRLRARHGTFFVTGNHEYYSGAEEWIEHLQSLGIVVLGNRHVRVGGARGFDVAGIYDHQGARFAADHVADVARATHGRDTSRALVLLAHQPKALHDAALAGVDLQLSGHTHGGQIFPWGYLVRLTQPVLEGFGRMRDTMVYVSRGTAYWGPPMRLMAPSEITVFEIDRA